MKFRSLKKRDIPHIQNLALTSWLFTYRNIYTKERIRQEVSEYYADDKVKKTLKQTVKGNESFIVAEEDTKVVGYAHISEDKNRWELQRIYVDPNHLRQGIGSHLLEKIEAFLRKKEINQYIAHPHTENSIAVNFYKKKGFKRYPKGDRGQDSPCFLKKV